MARCLSRLLLGIFVAVAVQVPAVLADDADAEIAKWVSDLSHDQYLRREKANRKLVAIGTPAIQPLVTAMDSGDLELVERAMHVITEIGFSKSPRDDGGAWDQLSSIASTGTGQKASRAQRALSEIRAHRASQAKIALTNAGITIGIDKIFALASARQRLIVTIGDTWNGDPDSLQWLRWLYRIQNARVKGKAGSREVIEQVVKIPDLMSISFVDATVDKDSLEPLKQLKRIHELEFRYVNLKDEYGELIAALPIRLSLELMGTGISEEVVAVMQENLPGLRINHRQGGFLGVQCTADENVCQITHVLPRSAAQKAGLFAGDIIIHVGDSVVTKFADLQKEINRHVPGDELEVRLRRGGQIKSVQLKLGRFEDP